MGQRYNKLLGFPLHLSFFCIFVAKIVNLATGTGSCGTAQMPVPVAIYFGCKAAIKRVQRELAHFVERKQARTPFKSAYSRATFSMQGQALWGLRS